MIVVIMVTSFEPVTGLAPQKPGPLNPTWQQCPRNFEPERLSSLEVDGQLVLGWRLHGEVFRLGNLENAVDIRRSWGNCSAKSPA
jgi:hypothetical protein